MTPGWNHWKALNCVHKVITAFHSIRQHWLNYISKRTLIQMKNLIRRMQGMKDCWDVFWWINVSYVSWCRAPRFVAFSRCSEMFPVMCMKTPRITRPGNSVWTFTKPVHSLFIVRMSLRDRFSKWLWEHKHISSPKEEESSAPDTDNVQDTAISGQSVWRHAFMC